MTKTPHYNDPFAIVWDALAHGEYGPRGSNRHDFRSRCTLHGDNDTSLHVWDNGDGVVQLHCFAHECDTDDILSRIGLRWQGRYPVGHYQSGRRLTPARRSDFTGNASDPA